ncbi:hypothetical protein RB195_023874 [Necator americanus]|uniref:Uncharacterized protein n=1 Tax=Necator americanus TaxID=51031 RepID=A0ABR1ELR6_NECAM
MTKFTYNAHTLASKAAVEDRGTCDNTTVCSGCPPKHEYGNKHRLFQTTNDPNRTSRIGCSSTPPMTIFFVFQHQARKKKKYKLSIWNWKSSTREVHHYYKVIVGDFKAKITPRRTPNQLHIGTHVLHRNE